MSENRPPILALAGPTAVGKSGVALALADRICGEIISVDSMQVYRGMDIGTAKPSKKDQERVPHHLLDVVEPSEPFDAAQFVKHAGAAIIEIRTRGHLPILCGGTGLYFKALLEGIGKAPRADPGLRLELESTPLGVLLQELKECDPVTFERIDRKNPRRVLRAVEVLRLTGKPFSEQRVRWSSREEAQNAQKGHASESMAKWDAMLVGLARPAEELKRRIGTRVEQMFGQGLVDETRRLLEKGLAGNRTAMQALGYRQVAAYLNGERSYDETVELVKVRTRQYARRQMTWFRRQMSLKWIELKGDDTRAVVELLASRM